MAFYYCLQTNTHTNTIYFIESQKKKLLCEENIA